MQLGGGVTVEVKMTWKELLCVVHATGACRVNELCMHLYTPVPVEEEEEVLPIGAPVGVLDGEMSVVTRPDTLKIPTPEDCFK